jgi:hypothetical protein
MTRQERLTGTSRSDASFPRRRILRGDTETPGLLENNLAITPALFTYFTTPKTGSLTMRTALRFVKPRR